MSSQQGACAPISYARHASAGFNARMHTWLAGLTDDVRTALGENLTALLLGGGYGRGEGGVLEVAGEERPYNDLDLILVVQRRADVPLAKLRALQHKYEPLLGIQVDFSRPLTLRDIRSWRPILMWTDLLYGHIVLHGPADILTANAPDLRTEQLGMIEATRTLLNRGAGLLWALRILHGCQPAPDSDFVRRNYFKSVITLGDALLIAHGLYSTLSAGRSERLSALLGKMSQPLSFDLMSLYSDALRFKFWPAQFPDQPDEPKLMQLAKQWGEVFLYVEGRRAQRVWRNVQMYVECPDYREPEQNTWRNWPRNFIRNRELGLLSVRYPRERLYRDLPVLLGLCEPPVGDWPAKSARFLEIWDKVN